MKIFGKTKYKLLDLWFKVKCFLGYKPDTTPFSDEERKCFQALVDGADDSVLLGSMAVRVKPLVDDTVTWNVKPYIDTDAVRKWALELEAEICKACHEIIKDMPEEQKARFRKTVKAGAKWPDGVSE